MAVQGVYLGLTLRQVLNTTSENHKGNDAYFNAAHKIHIWFLQMTLRRGAPFVCECVRVCPCMCICI